MPVTLGPERPVPQASWDFGPGRLIDRGPVAEGQSRFRGEEYVMSKINWKLIAFIGVLWWLIYSAPTEDSLFTMFVHRAGGTSASDDF